MALHYILDGYNIIHKISSFWCGSGQKSREKLIRYIKNKRPQGSPKNKVTIVFDGTKDVYETTPLTLNLIQGGRGDPAHNLWAGSIEVIFTPQMSADDYIIQLIKRSANPKIITVVSDDKEVQKRAVLLDAKATGVKEFFKSRSTDKTESDKPALTNSELKEIEEELLSR